MTTPTGTGFTGPGKRLAETTVGPWKRWRTKSRHARAIRFIETYCRPPKGMGHGTPLKLARFQKQWLEAVLAKDVDVGILQTPRGNGKSSLGGALAVWAAFDDDATGSPQVPIVATTIGQAIRSCYGVAVSMVKAEPELLKRSLIYTGVATPRIMVPFNDAELFPISNDPDGLQGLDPSLAIVDEVGFQPMESWDALQLAQGKRQRSVVLGLGTPGLDRDNALFHLRQLVREGAFLPGTVFTEYSVPEGADVNDRKLWRLANPALAAGFLSLDALERARARTLEGAFRTFRLGQWIHGVDSWLGTNGAAIWEGLTNPWEFIEGAATWVGVDVALKRDTSAVVALQYRPDEKGKPAGRLHAVSKIWRPATDRPVDTTDIMKYIRDLDDRYDIQAVSYDPRFFDVPAKMLEDEQIRMFEIPQSRERMTVAAGALYEAILGSRVTHDGDKAFAVQVLNAVPRFTENGFTLAKGKSRGKIDACIALALALERADRQAKPKRKAMAVSF